MEQQFEQTAAPTAIAAGVQTARAQELLLEGQRRTYDARLSKAYCVGIRKFAEAIDREATQGHTTCYLFASGICDAAFRGQPESIHQDIHEDLVDRLKAHFDSLGYVARASHYAPHSKVILHWQSASALPELDEDEDAFLQEEEEG